LDLNDESKYEDIDDLRADKHDYLECATDSISLVQSGKSLSSSDEYIVPTPEYLDIEEKSSDIPGKCSLLLISSLIVSPIFSLTFNSTVVGWFRL
jgi:hypothetical protein